MKIRIIVSHQNVSMSMSTFGIDCVTLYGIGNDGLHVPFSLFHFMDTSARSDGVHQDAILVHSVFSMNIDMVQNDKVNALDDQWVAFFEKTVQDWENGNPDALILTTLTINPDWNCKAVRGEMKAYNGDYGETGWRGVN